jgi:uncharacterized repeat protein (TIGR01451 family)
MFEGKKAFIAVIAFSWAAGSQAFAADPGCIELKSVAEVKQEVVDAKGEKSTKLVPATKVLPGVEVIWTVTAKNVCKQPSEKVTINNAVPAHMTYVANSASGAGSEISYSLDGKSFGAPAQLTVQENGAARSARADEYQAIRWTFKDPLQPAAQVSARFSAVLN